MKAFDCVKTNYNKRQIVTQKVAYYLQIANWIDSYYRKRSQFTVWEEVRKFNKLKKPCLLYSLGETGKQKIDKKKIPDNFLGLHCHL